jgi:regulator of protease activity HflC (stomatin/prohibitin superfamily)
MQSSLRLFVLLIIVGAFFLMRYLRVVPAGHIMVVDVFGKVRSEALPSGLHLINPFAALHRMSVQTQEGKKRRLYSGRSGGNSAASICAIAALINHET